MYAITNDDRDSIIRLLEHLLREATGRDDRTRNIRRLASNLIRSLQRRTPFINRATPI